jgi:hypothetical protein
MSYITYGDVHRRAREAGLVMGRLKGSRAVQIRHRDPSTGSERWDDLDLQEALVVIQQFEAQRSPTAA